jgi:SAM-dependent methyltransferase
MLEKKLRKIIGKGYITADLFDQKVDLLMDITKIQFPDNFFDFIYCSHVLEHVPDDRQAMREFKRVLAINGVAFLNVPITTERTVEDPSISDPQERLRLFGQDDHVRRYGLDYVSRLEDAGFSVNKILKFDFLTHAEIELIGLSNAMTGELYICT